VADRLFSPSINEVRRKMNETTLPPANPKWMTWTGRVLTALLGALLTFSAVMKFTAPPLDPAKAAAKADADAVVEGASKEASSEEMPSVAEEFARLGYQEKATLPIAVAEIASTVLYVIPQTTVLGAVLLTGYLGGATATHVRIDDPFVGPIIIGVLVWVGVFLREPRLRAILPWRR
jgi:hypothetical protein